MRTKKIFAAALAAVVSAAAAVTVYAYSDETPGSNITLNKDKKSDGTNVTYNIPEGYTVTIPAGVTLSSSETVTAPVEASEVIIPNNSVLVVSLTAAANTASGTTFHAKNGESVVTYSITSGNNTLSVGGIAASFTADGTQDLVFSPADASAATASGSHSETLTFTISLEDIT